MPGFCPSRGSGEGARDGADEDDEDEDEDDEESESESELEELALFFAFLPDGIVTELGKKTSLADFAQKTGLENRRLYLTAGAST